MINIKRLNDEIKRLHLTKKEVCVNSGLSRVTLDKILNGGEVTVSTLEALAHGIGVKVGYFFDDEVQETVQEQTINGIQQNAGRDVNYGINMEEHDELIRLREEVKYIKQSLKDKDERISELKERIEELKAR